MTRSEEEGADWPAVVSFLLSVTAYDVAANLTAFGCAVSASLLLGLWTPALLSGVALACWLALARRTIRARRLSQTLKRNSTTSPSCMT